MKINFSRPQDFFTATIEAEPIDIERIGFMLLDCATRKQEENHTEADRMINAVEKIFSTLADNGYYGK